MKLAAKEAEYVWDVLTHLLAAGHAVRTNGEPFPMTPAGTIDGTAARRALDYVWEHREVIDQILARSNDLSPTKRMLLRRWKEQAIFGLFTVYGIEEEDALIVGPNLEISIWRVRAISSPWEDMTAHLPFPVLFQGALLPFGNSVIVDGLMAVRKGDHSPDTIQPLLDGFRLAKESGPIRSSFPPYSASASTRRTGGIKTKKKGKRK